VLFMGNNLPSALYGVLRAAFGYSSLTQTLLYAVAVAVILPGVAIFGPLSDVIGRRVLVVAGLLSFGAGDVLFVVAHHTAELFAARVVQGLGMALATAAATATLSDTAAALFLDHERAHRIAALTTTACVTGGLAFGPLLAGILAQYGPAQLKLPFIVHLARVAIALAAARRLPSNPARAIDSWRPVSFRVPVSVRQTFPLIAASGLLAWTVLGGFSAVIPSFLTELLDTKNVALASGALALMIATSALAQVGAHRLHAVSAQLVGLGALAVGLALLVSATIIRDPILIVLAMVGCGVGHGFIFVGGMSEINVATPAEERGAVIGTVYLVNYIGLGGPVIGVGMLSLSYGLLAATRVAAAVIVALCVLLIPFVVARARLTGQRQRGKPDSNHDVRSCTASILTGNAMQAPPRRH
jgi:MFS family permease